jgi:hypothetical protein
VRVSSSSSTRAALHLAGPGGRALARSRTVRLQAGRTRTVALRPTPAGERLLGRCTAVRVTLTLRESGGARRRVRGRTTRDPVRCAPLHWAAPALENPETIQLGQGFSDLRLEAERDYILRLSRTRKLGGIWVIGGRNVVVVGGHVTVPPAVHTDERRALYFKNQTGTVHVEGVLIDASGGGEADGIVVNAPQAVVQVQSTRIVGLRGSERGTHADVVQPWGGARELRIDRLTGSSHFQGLEIPADLGPIGSADVRFTDLEALPPLSHGGGHMLWLTTPYTCTGYPVRLQSVYVQGRPGRSLRYSVWPQADGKSECAGIGGRRLVRWPALPVTGEVRAGAPAGGDYVPRWSVGTGYRPLGYETGAAPAVAGRALVASVPVVGCLLFAPICRS